MSVLFITNANPHAVRYLPPAEGRCYLVAQPYRYGPVAERPDFLFGPPGEFSLPELLAGCGRGGFDTVIYHTDPAWSFIPRGLNQVADRTAVIFGDMHHTHQPIARAVAYALRERPYAIASAFTRQHLHWFMAAGFTRFLWEPSFFVTPTQERLNGFGAKRHWLTFCGSTSAHPRRARLLSFLKERVPDFATFQGSRAESGAFINDSALCLNMSLNGDFNMRCFEIVADGGLLVSDRISRYSGFFDLYTPGRDCLVYDSQEELLDLVGSRRLLTQVAPEIMENARALYRGRFHPDLVWARFLDNLEKGAFPDHLNWDDRAASSMSRAQFLDVRIAIYEMAQELHRNHDRLFVDLSPIAKRLTGSDLDDLTRVFPLSARQDQREGDAVFFVGITGEEPTAPFTHRMQLTVG